MAGAKEIRTKIASIKNTQKITRAMEMMSASKMRKAQERMHTSRPYSHKITNVIQHLAQSHSEYRHPYLNEREVKRVGVIVVSSDRGLCGGLNNNLFRSLLKNMHEWKDNEIEIDLCTIGKKAKAFFKRFGGNVVAMAEQLGDSPSINDLIGVVKAMLDAYDEGRLDAIYIAYNEFVTTMNQKPCLDKMLPLPKVENDELKHHWDYIYEPEAKELMDQLLTRYIESLVYQSVVENIACEQAARMVAMKSASDNAGDLIDEFQLIYNKARQSAITQEISEIVAGAAAV